MKTLGIYPNTQIETVVGSYLSKHFNITPLKLNKNCIENHGQELYGEWCALMKIHYSMYRQALDSNIKSIIAPNPMYCHYPIVFGDLNKWIGEDFNYYPIDIYNGLLSIRSFQNFFRQLKLMIPDYSKINFYLKVPYIIKRLQLASEMESEYQKNIPLVKNPRAFQLDYQNMKNEFINAKNFKESKIIYDKLNEYIAEHKIAQIPKYRFLITGDFSLLTIGFHLFNLEIELAKYGAELIKPVYYAASYQSFRMFPAGRRAIKELQNNFSVKRKVNIFENYALELIFLAQIYKGLEQEVDGIINIRTNLCPTADNLSYILKKNKYYGLPYVEVSYDEHSAENGILTRLEAFMNIVSEKK